MFYSQSFLARKGPLGTVWIAAHMQNRLRKSHYTSTNIPSTVDRIMFPEVPLALRMSSHLLLGVVRIYSKQVDYLFDDCNVALTRLRKAFDSIDLNLPEDARQAPVQAITLPETFDLDAMDLDDGYILDRVVDDHHHHKNQEDITIFEQIPTERETYVCITFDEDVLMNSSLSPSNQTNAYETLHHNINGLGFSDHNVQDPGPSNRPETHESRRSIDDNLFDVIPEIEVMRDARAVDNTVPPPLSPNFGNISEPRPTLDEAVMNEETISPIVEKNLPSPGQARPFQLGSGPQVPNDAFHDDLVNNDNSPVSFAIRSTPPVQNPKPKPRPRKRKQLYDEAPVLTNKFMKKALEDTTSILRKRTKLPQSALGLWKLKHKSRKEQVFVEPSITGMCSDLCDIFNDNYVSNKLKSSKEVRPDSEAVRSPILEPEIPESPRYENTEYWTPTRDDAQEMEVLRHDVRPDEQNTMSEIIPSPTVTPSVRRDDNSPSLSQTFRSTPAIATGSDMPSGYSEERRGLDYTALSDVPEENALEDDLFFLEADNTPAGSQGTTQGVNSLSVRTRAVAQYLKRHSPISPFSEGSSESICLNKLLQGKTRKLCARMFFETLVLRSNNLIDVEQETPFGEINLRLTSLSKAQL